VQLTEAMIQQAAATAVQQQRTATLKQQYLAYLAEKIAAQQRYPKQSRRRNEQGSVQVRVTLSKVGKLQRVALVESSGYTRLDREAVKMVRRAAPFQAIPASLEIGSLTLVVPVEFRIENSS